jgi:hypothetical protein
MPLDPVTPFLEPMFRASIAVAPPRVLGRVAGGDRRIIDILGGEVEGPRLAGRILPGGADWQIVRTDGVVELEARYLIRTRDGVEIAVLNRGLRRAPPEVMERLSRGEPVDPALVYFRTVPVFEAPAGPYDWLNRSLFLGLAARLPDKVHLRIFEVT